MHTSDEQYYCLHHSSHRHTANKQNVCRPHSNRNDAVLGRNSTFISPDRIHLWTCVVCILCATMWFVYLCSRASTLERAIAVYIIQHDTYNVDASLDPPVLCPASPKLSRLRHHLRRHRFVCGALAKYFKCKFGWLVCWIAGSVSRRCADVFAHKPGPVIRCESVCGLYMVFMCDDDDPIQLSV